MRLNAHVRIEIALGAMLLLGSCGDNAYRRFTEGDYDRLDVADVNARNAIHRVDALESRVAELEQRLGM
ncbi:hypothetical protein [Novosphingobium sp. CECT 9465]|uniref:hypothetical protein n=1 Tax=Novosphingobium sp. CECT 9465 TaxID=2829794 RepID=UPI001E5B57E6|nr:hypothetical protein [Novosphingobium sp. CECT 9465]CAH0495694.1 hypothetical protein NVSP9465_00702 [Novosphingobium sp. CECT 9465]